MTTGKRSILYLCTGNSCRSQMAEGWTRYLLGSQFEAYSAGIEVHGLNPRAVVVMAETGVDISGHRSKHVTEFLGRRFDYVITVCDNASQRCPFFPASEAVIHRSFPDPPALAKNAATEEDVLVYYRRVRDEIKTFVEGLPEILKHPR